MKKVSVITPWYNGISFVDRYMKMILAQTYAEIELIFIDDGSTDGVIEKIHAYELKIKKRGFQIIYLFQNHAGQAAALNQAFKVMSGDYMMSIDSDDIIEPSCIEKRVAFLEKNKEYGMVTSKGWEADEFNLDEKRDVYWMQECEKENLFKQIVQRKISTFLLPYLFRTAAFHNVLPENSIYVNDKTTIQDVQVILPMAYECKCGFIDEYLYTYVIRESSGCHEFISYPHKLNYYDGVEEIWIETYNRMRMPEDEKQECIEYTKKIYAHYRNGVIFDYLFEKKEEYYIRRILGKKEIVLFGAGDFGERLYGILKRKKIKVSFFIDNSTQKQERGFCGLKVKSVDSFLPYQKDYLVLVVAAFHNQAISEQLINLGLKKNEDFYLYPSSPLVAKLNIFEF